MIAKTNLAGTEYVALETATTGSYIVIHQSLNNDTVEYRGDYGGFESLDEALEFIDDFDDWADDELEVDAFLNEDLH